VRRKLTGAFVPSGFRLIARSSRACCVVLHSSIRGGRICKARLLRLPLNTAGAGGAERGRLGGSQQLSLQRKFMSFLSKDSK